METQENFNEKVIGAAALKGWTAPEIKILDLGNTQSGSDFATDGNGHTTPS